MKTLVALCLMISMAGIGCAAATAVLYGDKDGFGLGIRADEQFDCNVIDSRITSGDGNGTDIYWNIPGGTNTYTWDFSYNPLNRPIKAATLEIFHGGTAEGSKLFLDGVLIGRLSAGEGPGRVGTWARIDIFHLPLSILHLLDGDNILQIRTIWGGNLAVDYFQLTIK